MTVMRRHLWKIIAMGILCAAGYFVFTAVNVSGYRFPSVGISGKGTTQGGGQAISGVVDAMKKKFLSQMADVVDVVKQNADTLAQSAIVSAKTEAFKLLSNAVNDKVKSVATGLGISASGSAGASGGSTVIPVQSAIKSGAPAYFTIKNSESEAVHYAIDWNDGKNESGQIAKGESQIVSHSWMKAGEYVLQFTIESSGGTNKYQVTISIL